MFQFKKVCSICIALITVIIMMGCSVKVDKLEKVKDLDFTVVSEESLPKELKEIIKEQKSKEFKMTYYDKEYLYICVGYGEQESGGYSIGINELYLTENAIYFDSNLIGPNKQDSKKKVSSYPYIVAKLEAIDKTVVFD